MSRGRTGGGKKEGGSRGSEGMGSFEAIVVKDLKVIGTDPLLFEMMRD